MMQTKTVLLVLAAVLHSALAHAQRTPDPVRDLANMVACQIADGKVDAIYSEMSPKLKRAYSQDELVAPLAVARKMYGRIVGYSFKVDFAQAGARLVGREWMRTVTYWYPIQTDKYPDGYWMKVDVTKEDGRLYLAGYSIVQFKGDQPPPELK